jgi:hypothetical protein
LLRIRDQWVAFHLLNNNVGGLAVDSNLIPTTQGVNREFRREFESHYIAARNTIPVWINATFSYYGEDPRFVQSLRVTGGKMKWDKSGEKWEEDKRSSAQFPTFSRGRSAMPLPRVTAIPINRMPADPRERARLLTGSRLTAAMVNIIMQNVRTRIERKEDIIGILRNYVYTLRRRSEAEDTMRDFIERVNATTFDFSP